jgi:hypothetical protein
MSDTLQFVDVLCQRRVQSQHECSESRDKLKRVEHRMSDTLQFVDVLRQRQMQSQHECSESRDKLKRVEHSYETLSP